VQTIFGGNQDFLSKRVECVALLEIRKDIKKTRKEVI
jgi:hypothetical protein